MDGYHRQRFNISCKGKGIDSLPEGLVPNGHVTKVELDFAWRNTLGEYLKIRQIREYTFELSAGQLVQTHQLLDQT